MASLGSKELRGFEPATTPPKPPNRLLVAGSTCTECECMHGQIAKCMLMPVHTSYLYHPLAIGLSALFLYGCQLYLRSLGMKLYQEEVSPVLIFLVYNKTVVYSWQQFV